MSIFGKYIHRKTIAAVAVLGLLSGCTTHLATEVDGGSDTEPPVGIPYHLPKRQLTIEARWTLDSCSFGSDDSVAIGFAPSATFAEELTEGERLVIDYTKMTGPFKTGQAEITYWKIGEGDDARQTGYIKSFNGEIKGEEAAVIKSVIGGAASAAKLALSAGGVQIAGGGDGQAPPILVCDPTLFEDGTETAAINYLKESDAKLAGIAKKVEAATTKLTQIKTRTIGVLSPADEAKFDEINASVEKLEKEKEVIEKAVTSYLTAYSITEKVEISDFSTSDILPDGVIGDSSADFVKTIKPDREQLLKLAMKAIVCNPKLAPSDADTCAAGLRSSRKKIEANIDDPTEQAKRLLTAYIDVSGEDANALAKASFALSNAAPQGLVYREPKKARFWLTIPALLDPKKPNAPAVRSVEKLADKTISIPQIGRVVILPLRSRFAEKNGLSAEFEADGMPSKISYKAIESGGAAIFDNLKLGLDEARGVADAINADRKAKKAEEEGAQLAAIKDQIALLTEQQKLSELSKAPDPLQASREAELQLLRFEKEKAELQKAILAAQAP